MDPEEAGFQDGFPLGDGGFVPEAAVVRGDDGGDVVVGFDVKDILEGEGDGFPVRCERDGGRLGGALPVQPGLDIIIIVQCIITRDPGLKKKNSCSCEQELFFW